MTVLQELEFVVSGRIDLAFRKGDAPIDYMDCLNDLDIGREIEVDQAVLVLEEAMNRFTGADRASSDAWVGPRLHHALRLSRREAARKGVWRFMGVVASPQYVRWRWGRKDVANLERFVGADYKQAVARLWWMAELFRDGPDYRPAVKALEIQDLINNLYRMDVAHHRPTAQGAIRLLVERRAVHEQEGGNVGDEANALAKAVNAAATTLLLDDLAPDEPLDETATRRWIEGADDVDPRAYFDSEALPDGPDDPPVSERSVQTMQDLLAELLEETPLRLR